jgi:hypothetical protein
MITAGGEQEASSEPQHSFRAPHPQAPYLGVLDELVPNAAHVTEQYANNPVETIMLG